MDTVLLIGMGPTALSALESLTARFQVAGLVRDARSLPEAAMKSSSAPAPSWCQYFPTSASKVSSGRLYKADPIALSCLLMTGSCLTGF